MIENDMEGRKIGPDWIRPDLEKERGEIERTIREFLREEPNDQNIQAVASIFESAPVVDLSDEEWSLLENTDSFSNVRPGHAEDAEKITENYNIEYSPELKRDFKKTLMGFLNRDRMRMPTILKNKEGVLYLVSGNTRLMICRALNIRPKVIVGEVN